MLNVSPLEIAVIMLLALVLFGPRRLPELARKAGDLIRELRRTTDEFRSGLEREYEEVVNPIKEMGEEARRAIEEEPDRGSEEAERPSPE